MQLWLFSGSSLMVLWPFFPNNLEMAGNYCDWRGEWNKCISIIPLVVPAPSSLKSTIHQAEMIWHRLVTYSRHLRDHTCKSTLFQSTWKGHRLKNNLLDTEGYCDFRCWLISLSCRSKSGVSWLLMTYVNHSNFHFSPCKQRPRCVNNTDYSTHSELWLARKGEPVDWGFY